MINSIGPDNLNKKQSLKNSVKTGFKASAAVTALNLLLLPPEAKFALRNCVLNEDKFISKTAKAAEKTIKNLKKAGKEKAASAINIKETMERAKLMYPEISVKGKSIARELGKNFAILVGATTVASLVLDKVLADKKNK